MTIRWGILGTAKFAREHMGPAIHAARGAELVAVASRDPVKVAPFQAFAPRAQAMGYDEMLACDTVEAVYIPLPHPMHVPWGVKALEAGKHVLVEKPTAMSAPEIAPLIAARDASGLVATEAYMIVHHPQWDEVRRLLAEGAIGTLGHVNAVFTYNNAGDPGNIRNAKASGGGSLPDVGVYTIGATRWATGIEPTSIPHAAIIFEDDCEVTARVAAQFSGFTASWLTSMRMDRFQEMTFHGSDGVIRVPCPFNPSAHDQARVILERGATRFETRFPAQNQYVTQVENVCAAIRGEADLLWTLENARGTQQVIDDIRAAARDST